MIRPVLYVNLPGIVRAFDSRARARQGDYANFVVAPEIEEPRSGPAALLSAILPITPDALTWICEDHWRLLGLAQARIRPGGLAWDLAYLAALTSPALSTDANDGTGATSRRQEIAAQALADDTLMELLQYALNAAIRRGVQRFFARVEDERPELELFGKLGFQRYARESTWLLESALDGLAALDASAAAASKGKIAEDATANTTIATTTTNTSSDARRNPLATLVAPVLQKRAPVEIRPDAPLRPWRRHDAWGLLRLYDACTPRRVQVAESLTSEEFVATRAGGGRTWYVPLLEPTTLAFVTDRGARLGGWLRLRFGRGSQPHLLSLMTHPDEDDLARALLRFALRVFAQEAPRPVICQTREYETEVIDTLRAAGFSRIGTHALLVRHLTARLAWNSTVPAFDSRIVYGVKGFGTAPTRLSEGRKDIVCQNISTTISTPSLPSSPFVYGRRSTTVQIATICSRSSWTSDACPRDASPILKCR